MRSCASRAVAVMVTRGAQAARVSCSSSASHREPVDTFTILCQNGTIDGPTEGYTVNRFNDFSAWYEQVDGAADIDITELVGAFEDGVTPEEMNAR